MIMGVGRVIAKVSLSVCVCARVCVYMYCCLTFKLFDEKKSSLPRAEYESLRKPTDAEENKTSCFLQKVSAFVSELLCVFIS